MLKTYRIIPFIENFSLRQPIHILSKSYPWDSYLGVGVDLSLVLSQF